MGLRRDVKSDAARPYRVLLAIAMASSRSRTRRIGSTGPKISSSASGESRGTRSKTVGA